MAILRIPVEVASQYLPSPAMNIWHARVDLTGDIPNWGVEPLNGPLAALRDFYTAVAGMFPAGTSINFPTEVVEVTTQEVFGGYTPFAAVTNVGVNPAGPPGIAATISWRTSLAARRGRGRTFLGPLKGAVIDSDGSFAPGDRGTIQGAVNALVSSSTAVNGWALGVWGQESAGIPGTNVLRDFVSGTVQDKFAHLRSRRD